MDTPPVDYVIYRAVTCIFGQLFHIPRRDNFITLFTTAWPNQKYTLQNEDNLNTGSLVCLESGHTQQVE